MPRRDVPSTEEFASPSERRAAREGAARCRQRSGELRRESRERREEAWAIRSWRSETLPALDERKGESARIVSSRVPDLSKAFLPPDDLSAFVTARALIAELEELEASGATEAARAALRRERTIAQIEADALGRRLAEGF